MHVFREVLCTKLLHSILGIVADMQLVRVANSPGEEMTRTGKNEKYQEYMEEAHGLFSEHLDDFESRALPHVFYLHNRARFVSEKKERFDLEPKELYDEALEICEKEIPNHPEKALNLLFVGINAKRRNAPEDAIEKREEALLLFYRED